MSNIITLTARDGSQVQYVADSPKQGAIKDVYFAPDKSYVVAFYRKKLDDQGLRRIEKIVGDYHDSIFKGVGGDYWRTTLCWPTKIVENEGRTGIVIPTYSSNFYFKTGNIAGEEKEGKWWASAKNYNRFVPTEERGTLGGFLRACLELSRAIRRLHAAGLAHSDLSYKNCLIDPVYGRACVIDVDGLVVPGLFPPDVLGTRDFMAPEVVSTSKLSRTDPNRCLPNRSTDLHALAVLIYLCLFHRHPLRGMKYSELEPEEQDAMLLGKDAVFIEHPTDPSNRRKIERGEESSSPWIDVNLTPYTICGPYLKELFDRTFIDGIAAPMKRPSANDWEDALIKTLDLLLPCSNPKCVKHEFVYSDSAPRQVCPYCGSPYKESVPAFDYYFSRNGIDYKPDRRTLVGYEGKELFLWNVERNVEFNEKLSEEQRRRVAVFTKDGDNWGLKNELVKNLSDLTEQCDASTDKIVPLTNNKRLSLSETPNSYVAQVRLVNQKKAVGPDASLAIFLDVVDSLAKKGSSRVDSVLQKLLSWRMPSGTVGQAFKSGFSFKELSAPGGNVSVSVLKEQGFDDFGLTCRIVDDRFIVEGVPILQYNGRVEIYVNGRFKSSHPFRTSKIPGEFRFNDVHLSKTWEIKSSRPAATEPLAGEIDPSAARAEDRESEEIKTDSSSGSDAV